MARKKKEVKEEEVKVEEVKKIEVKTENKGKIRRSPFMDRVLGLK